MESEQLGEYVGENNWQTGDNISETPVENDQVQNNGYQYDSDTGNGIQDNIQQWNGVQQNNNDQNNNVQNNNAWNNNPAWNNQSQTGNNMQTTSRADNESAVKMPENLLPTSTPVPTPKPTEKIRSQRKNDPDQLRHQRLSYRKKGKIRRNKIKQRKQQKENTNTDNSKVLQNKKDQGDIAEYMHVKDESVRFYCTQNTDSSHTPQIQIISQGSVQILSFRLNKTECPWHWEGDRIIPETEDEKCKRNRCVGYFSRWKTDQKMDPWSFFCIDASGKQCYNLSYYIIISIF